MYFHSPSLQELRRIKDGLEEAAVSPQSVERLSTERAMLAKERVELLGRLAAIHEVRYLTSSSVIIQFLDIHRTDILLLALEGQRAPF